ncbi:ABC-2 type transport system ATP-binding protein [Amycolatopsis xylanica]|uniref:ABC-2 type transport system ATP-binding protein n=1 Tax=Amycolatopsis xylanica TaxID=589385 RepID=A0A1H3AYT7_9PSEU|nr:ABC transporter ATP-binding protein [Amycolatopsis xylanica]SDX33979.1 ABC-2 type transport system ATP-binding protein [Amycolatopsis xylanica]
MPIVEVKNLRKSYPGTVAVDDVSFHVEPGEIFGILGTNGAGKTTTVECLLGLRHPDAGSISAPAKEKIGAQLQEAKLPEKLKVREALELYASFYRQPADPVALLDQLGLTELAERKFGKLSGGQKQRVSIALALVGDPEIAVLDELTTGLDPHARRDIWKVIEAVRERGVTILLVSHFMDEAQRLCDRVAVFDNGRVVATDTPAGLMTAAGTANLDDAFVALTGRN